MGVNLGTARNEKTRCLHESARGLPRESMRRKDAFIHSLGYAHGPPSEEILTLFTGVIPAVDARTTMVVVQGKEETRAGRRTHNANKYRNANIT